MEFGLKSDLERPLLATKATQKAATERIARLWRFLAITTFAWVFFFAFYCIRGYPTAALVCFAETLCGFILIRQFRLLRRSLLMHTALISSTAGLFAISICQDAHLNETIYFVLCTIIVSAHLIGGRAALTWCIVTMSVMTLHFIIVGRDAAVIFDQTVTGVGLTATIFFICQQVELLFEKRTRHLIELSQQLKVQSNDMKKLATTDHLTGLDNRYSLLHSLKKEVRRAVRDDTLLAVMVLDMDGFKGINDAMGHAMGDEVLKKVAARLWDYLPSKATAARLGGDEFCVLIPDVGSASESEEHAKNIVEALRKSYRINNYEPVLEASIGICLCPEMSEAPNELVAYADTAMYHAKPSSQRFRLYEKQMTDRIVHRITMQEKLKRAIERDEFRVVFQPQFDISTQSVPSVEALLRWELNGQSISPVEFIPLLESSGEIVDVSRWVVRQCCRQIQAWRDSGFHIRVSINLSAVEFAAPGFIASVKACQEEFQIDPSLLEFEITESLLIENVEETIQRLNELKQMGASISVDDFGTGYSSLSYLRQFPIDRLKIDRSFVKDFPDLDDGLLASSIILLGQALDMKVIAEGVETQQQLEFLANKGCDEYQGYLLSPPVSAKECEKFFGAPIFGAQTNSKTNSKTNSNLNSKS